MTATFTGFVHADGDRIVDGSGNPLLLRGVGLGNWLLPEGYMWRFGDEMSSPRQIEARVLDLVGSDRAEQFWTRYLDSFITEADVQRIATLGYDHVRLPLNSRGLITDDGELVEAGFARVDDLIRWCRTHGLWVLLDLHGAPGGQTGTNIDDSPHGKPELFMDERYRDLTVELWRGIARRYRHETAVLGYDLLNEPIPNEWQHVYPTELIDLYARLTREIRVIDPDHLIMYEGSHWATNWSIFTTVLDTNSALQFHRYWCAPDHSSIAEYLEVRDRLGLPIYMGEGGENTPEWIYAAHRLYEQHGIGWNLWPWKKLGTVTSPVSASVPHGWDVIANPDEQPEADLAWSILESFLEAIPLAACEERPRVVDASLGQGELVLPAWGHLGDERDRFAGQDISTVWHHTAGEPYSEDEVLPMVLAPGEVLRFALAGEPSEWEVDGEPAGALLAQWRGDHLAVSAPVTATLRRVTARVP